MKNACVFPEETQPFRPCPCREKQELKHAQIFLDIMRVGLLRRLMAREAEIDAEVERHWQNLEGYLAIKPRYKDSASGQRERRAKKKLRQLRAA